MKKQKAFRPSNNRFEKLDAALLAFLCVFAIAIFYPFYNAVLTSFATNKEYVLNPVMLFPRAVTFQNYRVILDNPLIASGYRNTMIITVLGVIYSLVLVTTMAYAFSRRYFPGRKAMLALVLFTMFFSGGLIPLYLQIKNLGLMGSLSALILLFGVSPFYMILMKNSFEQIPNSIEEAAKIDGANDVLIFVRVMLPLQLPMLATLTLFLTVDRWNEWYYAMLILKEGDKWPMQVVLRAIIAESVSDRSLAFSSMSQITFSAGIKMAAVVVTMLPVMALYPFLQKYFVKGIIVGAIKM
jgi:putative aldouronate transport system permease protein